MRLGAFAKVNAKLALAYTVGDISDVRAITGWLEAAVVRLRNAQQWQSCLLGHDAERVNDFDTTRFVI
jgi:hypothetical protein